MYAHRVAAFAFAATIASVLTFSLTPAYAQKHSGDSGGSAGSHGGSTGGHGGSEGGCESGGGCSGGSGGKGGKGGQRGGHHVGEGGTSQSLRDIFHGLDASSETEHSGSNAHGGSSRGH